MSEWFLSPRITPMTHLQVDPPSYPKPHHSAGRWHPTKRPRDSRICYDSLERGDSRLMDGLSEPSICERLGVPLGTRTS